MNTFEEIYQAIKENKEGVLVPLKNHVDMLQKQVDEMGGKLKGQKYNKTFTPSDEILSLVQKANIKSLGRTRGTTTELFEVKSDTLTSAISGNTNSFVIPSIGQLQSQIPTISMLFNNAVLSSDKGGKVSWADWNDLTSVRAAAMRAEGTVFPESTAEWVESSLSLTKIADSIPHSEELLYDESRFANELKQFLMDNVALIEDTQLYSGDGTGNNVKGLTTYASEYTPAQIGLVEPNLGDLLLKIKEDIQTATSFAPDFVLLNPADLTSMLLIKQSDGRYIINPLVDMANGTIAGLMIVVTSTVAANSLLVGQRSRGTIYIEGGTKVSVGWTNEQFISDMIMIKARKRLNLVIKSRDAGAFRKCSDITAALATLGTSPA